MRNANQIGARWTQSFGVYPPVFLAAHSPPPVDRGLPLLYVLFLVLGKELEDLVREEEEDDVCLLAFAATPSFPLPLPYLQLSAAPILSFKGIIEQHT